MSCPIHDDRVVPWRKRLTWGLIRSHILASQIKRNVLYTLVEQIFSARLMNRRRFRLLAPTLTIFTGQVMIPLMYVLIRSWVAYPFAAPTLTLPKHSIYPIVHEWTPPSWKPVSLAERVDRSVLAVDSVSVNILLLPRFPEIGGGWSAGRIWLCSIAWRVTLWDGQKKWLNSSSALCEMIYDLGSVYIYWGIYPLIYRKVPASCTLGRMGSYQAGIRMYVENDLNASLARKSRCRTKPMHSFIMIIPSRSQNQ